MLTDNPIIYRDGLPRYWRRISRARRGFWIGIFSLAALLPVAAYISLRDFIDTSTTVSLFKLLNYWFDLLAPALAPLLVAGAIAGERERQGWDHLLLSRLSAGEIIWGKLFSRIWPIVLVSVLLLPLMVTLLIVGPRKQLTTTLLSGFSTVGMLASSFSTLIALLLLWLVGTLLLGLGITFANSVMSLYISFRSRNTRTAIAVAYGISLGGYIVTVMVAIIVAIFSIYPYYRTMLSSTSATGALNVPTGYMITMLVAGCLPSLLWAIIIPVVLLPKMIGGFGKINLKMAE
jgi:ABC-type transport system involved in multi-copper enzyme maturation permease subunit